MNHNYYSYKTIEFSCGKCGWVGFGEKVKIGELIESGFFINCPECIEKISGFILFPTLKEVMENGSEEDKLQHIWDYKTYPAFSDAERIVFDVAIAASQVPNAMNDDLAEEMRKHWDDGEIVEVMGVIALFGYLNRWNDSMGTQLEEPAAEDAKNYLGDNGWTRGKHAY